MASLLPTGETTFLDANGVPLAGGTVEFYIPGTTTPKDTWQNSAQTILNPNPVTLDSAGRAIIYGSGSYRQIVKDSLGNLIWDQETAEPNAGAVSFGGTSGGTVNAQTLSAAQFSGVDGQIISFVAGLSNTGAMTISVGGNSPIAVLKNGPSGPVPLVAGDIVAGNSYFIQYSTALSSFQLLLSVAPALPTGAFLRGYLWGLTLSNNAADAVNDIDISAGAAASDGTTPALMTLAATLTKRLDSGWAVGTNQGGLDTGSIANTTYHVWLIQRSDTGVVDALFSTSATSPTMPVNYDRKRRIGSIMRVSAAIVPFIQTGDVFTRAVRIQDVSVVNPGTAAVTRTLSVPTGINVFPFGTIQIELTTVTPITIACLLTDLAQPDSDPGTVGGSVTLTTLSAGGSQRALSYFGSTKTNTSAQIRSRFNVSGPATNFFLHTDGWTDDRGRTS